MHPLAIHPNPREPVHGERPFGGAANIIGHMNEPEQSFRRR
jgi:hypothetical protein